jgi:hypothetical protein
LPTAASAATSSCVFFAATPAASASSTSSASLLERDMTAVNLYLARSNLAASLATTDDESLRVTGEIECDSEEEDDGMNQSRVIEFGFCGAGFYGEGEVGRV